MLNWEVTDRHGAISRYKDIEDFFDLVFNKDYYIDSEATDYYLNNTYGVFLVYGKQFGASAILRELDPGGYEQAIIDRAETLAQLDIDFYKDLFDNMKIGESIRINRFFIKRCSIENENNSDVSDITSDEFLKLIKTTKEDYFT